MFIKNPSYDRSFNVAAINLNASTGSPLPTTSPGVWRITQLQLAPENVTPIFSEEFYYP
jgi:hypothetical protein